MILFNHPRLTVGKWVLASCKLFGGKSILKNESQIKFYEIFLFQDDFVEEHMQGNKSINLLNSSDIILSCWKNDNLDIALITDKTNKDYTLTVNPLHQFKMG